MKVLMLGRPGLFKHKGGDRIQVENTAAELKKLGVDVVLSDSMTVDPTQYDLVHVFQLDWNPYCFFQIRNARKHSKPIVFSTIHHSVAELKRFDDEYVFGFRRLAKFIFHDQFKRDLLKEFYRALFDHKRLYTVLYSFVHGLKNMYRQALLDSDIILVQTRLEAEDLKKTYNADFVWDLVKNGVGSVYLAADLDRLKNRLDFSDYILCVGRIEPRKNQLSVIKAVESLRESTNKDFRLVLVGAKSVANHREYISQIDFHLRKYSWITHIDHTAYSDMPAIYKYAKVCVSASWFETTGLTSLEALFCSTNAVASGNRAREYLGEYASYCDPGNIDSIAQALLTELNAPRPRLPLDLRNEYTWENAARKTLEVYERLLK